MKPVVTRQLSIVIEDVADKYRQSEREGGAKEKDTRENRVRGRDAFGCICYGLISLTQGQGQRVA